LANKARCADSLIGLMAQESQNFSQPKRMVLICGSAAVGIGFFP